METTYKQTLTNILKKPEFYAYAALFIVLVFFAVPMAAFYGVPAKIKRGQDIPFYTAPLWNLYQTGRYISPTAPKGSEKNLEQMIDRHGEIGAPSAPVWRVALVAPNYPKDSFPDGIPIYFHLDGFSGDVHEMNTINHFIGMYPMERGAVLERAAAPYLIVIECFLILLFITVKRPFTSLGMLIPVALPPAFLGFYAGWLYWFGHNLQEWGMFKIKPFMPTVLGDGKVAQFTTHSYPSLGFFLFLITAALCLYAVYLRHKQR